MRCCPVETSVLLALGIFLAVPADAQRPVHVPRLGVLGIDVATAAPRVAAFLDGLRALGYVDGQTVAIEYRWAEGRLERLPALAGELVRLPVDILVTTQGLLTVRAAQRATTTIPIVSMIMNDPVAAGVVASLARPGGNITGQAFQDADISTKQLELLRETVPRLSRVAVLWHAAGSGAQVVQAVEASAQALGLRLHVQEVREPPDLERAVAAAKTWGAQALLQLPSPFLAQHRKILVPLLKTHQLPAMCETRMLVVEGCLMSYGASFEAMARRAAYYVDRILKGARPGDLPVEQPREFEFVVNRGTARGLGLALPPLLLFQATEVIQ
jgi:putative ABC transport system substrate-binding protein